MRPPPLQLVLLALLLFCPLEVCRAQQELDITPAATVELAVYTDEQPRTLTWSLSTPDISLTVHDIQLNQPELFLILSADLSAPVQTGAPVNFSVTVNTSIMQPAAYNVSLTITYGRLNQQMLVNVSLACLQAVHLTQNLTAPYELDVGQPFVTAIKLRSQPYSALNISVAINQRSGDYSGRTSAGVAWQGGGPLLTSNVSWLHFDSSNWNVTQLYTIASVYTPLIYGSRWSTVEYAYSTADSTLLQPLNATFGGLSPLNITIVESNVAAVRYANASFTLYKNAQPSVPLVLSLACQPRSPVELTFTSTAWTSVLPPTLRFTPDDWNVSVEATMLLAPDYTIGWEDVVVDFPLLSSQDADFAAVSGGRIALVLLDADPSFEWFAPQFGPPGTNLTLTWPSNLTFTPQSPAYPPPTVQCVFGASQYVCNTSATGYCPTVVPAAIVGARQVECEVPECEYDAGRGRACYSPAAVSVLVNGLPASLSVDTAANLTAACSPIGGCKVAPTVIFTGTSPVSAQCLGAGCPLWPAAFSYLPPPVITSVSPLTSELSTSNAITVVLTVVGAAPFTSPTALCVVGGQPSPAYATFAANTTTFGSQQSVVLTCLTPLRNDLLGSTSSTPLSFAVTLTGQPSDLSTTGQYGAFVLLGVDGVTVKQSADVTIFLVCCLLAFGSICGLVFQHYCCRDCRAINHQLTGEGRQRGERGPQMLIDLLEPRVRLKARLVEEEERQRRAEEREERAKVDEVVRKLKAEQRAEENKKRAETERVRAAMADKEQKRSEAGGARARSSSTIAVASTVKRVGGLARARVMLGMMKTALGDTDGTADGAPSPASPPARHARSGSVVASVLGRMRRGSTTTNQQQPQIVVSGDERSAPLLESKEQEAQADVKRKRSPSKAQQYLGVESSEERAERRSKKGSRSRSASPSASPGASPGAGERTLKPPKRERRPSQSQSRALSASPSVRSRGLQP